MRAVRSVDGQVRVVQLDGPVDPGLIDPVLVKIRSCGICGSDLHLLPYNLPCTMGHEFAGVLEDGTAVAVQPFKPCGTCDRCVAKAFQQCRTGVNRLHGVSYDGGLADEVIVERACLVPMPAGVPVEQGALLEPLAVSVRSLIQAGCSPKNSAEIGPLLVIGGGPIGLTVVAVARHWGFEIDLIARHPHQREAGERLGANLSLRNEYAVTVEAAGTQSSLDEAVARARPGGTVAVPGTYWSPIRLSNNFQVRHVSLVPSMVYGSYEGVRDFDLAAQVLAATPNLADALISHAFGLDDAPEAFRVAADRAAGALKVQILVN